jgi:hypothetical protein
MGAMLTNKQVAALSLEIFGTMPQDCLAKVKPKIDSGKCVVLRTQIYTESQSTFGQSVRFTTEIAEPNLKRGRFDNEIQVESFIEHPLNRSSPYYVNCSLVPLNTLTVLRWWYYGNFCTCSRKIGQNKWQIDTTNVQHLAIIRKVILETKQAR